MRIQYLRQVLFGLILFLCPSMGMANRPLAAEITLPPGMASTGPVVQDQEPLKKSEAKQKEPAKQEKPAKLEPTKQEQDKKTTQGDSTAKPELADVESAEIINIENTLKQDQQALKNLEDEIEANDKKFAKEKKALDEHTKKLTELQEQLASLQGSEDADERGKLKEEIKTVTNKKIFTNEAFVQAQSTRVRLKDGKEKLEAKIADEEKELARLNGEDQVEEKNSGDVAEPVDDPKKQDVGDDPVKEEESDTTEPASEEAESPGKSDETSTDELASEAVLAAEADSDAKAEAAQAANDQVKSLMERIKNVDESIKFEFQKNVDEIGIIENLDKRIEARNEELSKKIDRGGSEKEIKTLRQEIKEFEAEKRAAKNRYDATTVRLGFLETQLVTLRRRKSDADAIAAETMAEAEAAESKKLFTIAKAKISNWFSYNGPRVLLSIGLVILLWLCVRVVGGALLFVIRRVGRFEARDRVESLVHLIQNALVVAVFIGGFLITLSVAGVDPMPLLGGAAVAGVAVAFASQNLIRDYFHGIIMMLENQFTLNDKVSINSLSGTVEAITLRLTVLRDFEGNRHFIPNGEITLVTNLSHTWSRAVVEVQICREKNPNKVMKLLHEIAQNLRADERFSDDLLDDPEMVGVSDTGESTTTLKLGIKTKPERKQAIKCELLYRIKKHFDETNLELSSETIQECDECEESEATQEGEESKESEGTQESEAVPA